MAFAVGVNELLILGKSVIRHTQDRLADSRLRVDRVQRSFADRGPKLLLRPLRGDAARSGARRSADNFRGPVGFEAIGEFYRKCLALVLPSQSGARLLQGRIGANTSIARITPALDLRAD